MQRFILHTIFTRFASTAFNFLIALMIARHCGPAIKGDVTLLITTIWFFIFFSNILGGNVLVYLVPRNKIEFLLVPAYLWALFICITGFFLLKILHLVHANHIPSVAVLSLLSAVISIHQTILLGRKQITNSNLLQLMPVLLQFGGVLFCFYFLHINDAYAYIYASLVAYAVTALASFFLIRNYVNYAFSLLIPSSLRNPGANAGGGEEQLRLWNFFRYGLLFQLVEILQLLNLRYYFYQLGLQQGSQYLGIYSIGISILESVWIIPRSVATIHYVSTANAEGIKQEVDRTVLLTKWSFLFCAVALFAIWLIPARVYSFIFGSGFAGVKHSVRYLFPGILIYSIPIVISSFYLGVGKYRALIISGIAGVVSVITFSRLLIPLYVMSGAGLAATISFIMASVTLFIYFCMENNVQLIQFGIRPGEILLVAKKIRMFLNGLNE